MDIVEMANKSFRRTTLISRMIDYDAADRCKSREQVVARVASRFKLNKTEEHNLRFILIHVYGLHGSDDTLRHTVNVPGEVIYGQR